MMGAMSAKPPILRGDLADGGAVELLRACEARRITGELRFTGAAHDDGVSGVVRLIGGEIAVDQPPRDDGLDPVDLLLDLDSATYEVHQALPPLPVAKGDDHEKSGSLAVHVPVDLMSYCEKAGLTGVLELRHEGRRAEAVYEGGELITIELDGQDATDLQEVFAWEQGRFWIRLDPEAPQRFELEEEPLDDEGLVDGWAPAPPKKRENTRKFLRVVEMALVDVLDRSEKARSPTRTSPPLPEPPKARPRPSTIPPPPTRRRDEQTVRLVYLTGKRSPVERAESVSSTRHVQKGGERAERVGAEAAPERRARIEEDQPMAKKRRKKKKKTPAKRSAQPKASESKASESKASEPKDEAAPKKAAAGPEKPSDPKSSKSADSGPSSPPAPASPWMPIATASGWALGVLGLGLLILFVLGQLPPVE